MSTSYYFKFNYHATHERAGIIYARAYKERVRWPRNRRRLRASVKAAAILLSPPRSIIPHHAGSETTATDLSHTAITGLASRTLAECLPRLPRFRFGQSSWRAPVSRRMPRKRFSLLYFARNNFDFRARAYCRRMINLYFAAGRFYHVLSDAKPKTRDE